MVRIAGTKHSQSDLMQIAPVCLCAVGLVILTYAQLATSLNSHVDTFRSDSVLRSSHMQAGSRVQTRPERPTVPLRYVYYIPKRFQDERALIEPETDWDLPEDMFSIRLWSGYTQARMQGHSSAVPQDMPI